MMLGSVVSVWELDPGSQPVDERSAAALDGCVEPQFEGVVLPLPDDDHLSLLVDEAPRATGEALYYVERRGVFRLEREERGTPGGGRVLRLLRSGPPRAP
jgi:hypothetical protein